MDRHTRLTAPAARRLLAVTVAILLAAAGCTDDDGWRAEQRREQLPPATQISALRPVDDCDTLADAARPALEQAIEWAWGSSGNGVTADGFSDEQMSAAAESGGDAADAPTAQPPATTSAPTDDAGALRSAVDGDTSEPREAIGTNNQEQGVQESDLFVTDGELMVWVVDGVLRVAQNDDQIGIDGAIDLTPRAPTELFLRGDRALVMGTTFGRFSPGMDGPTMRGVQDGAAVDAVGPSVEEPGPTFPDTTTTDTTTPDEPQPTVPDTTATTTPDSTVPDTTAPTTTASTTTTTTTVVQPPPIEPAPFPVATTLTVVSLEDPSNPTVLASADVEGELVSARQVDGTTRVVVRSTPSAGLDPMAMPTRQAAIEAVESVEGDDLLPRLAVDQQVRAIGGCEDVFVSEGVDAGAASDGRADASSFAPEAALSTVTVLTVGDDLDDLAPVSLQGAADTVYASTEALYVAAGSWDQEGSRTDVHRFSMPADAPVTYSGSGRVPGRLLNQFSMSERDGALRIVTTTDGTASGTDVIDPAVRGGDEPVIDMVVPTFDTEARLTVLDTDGTLDELGFVDGLGVGEEVQSVRFIGDLGYVVTFRQTDPLYALDLSDPRNPTVLGELKITGFSEYLHPIGEDLLLGVGREADPGTGLDEGFKVSLFDISDPTNLTEVDKIVMAGTWSEVSQTHKAFTWDSERSQAIIPVDTSALVIGVDGATLQQRGSISHEAQWGPTAPRRSRVVDGQIWTVSEVALGLTPAASPGATSLLPH